MESGDYVRFNEKARPRYLKNNVAQVIAAGDSTVTIRVPSEGFSGDLRRFWKPGYNFLVPRSIVDLHAYRRPK